MTDPTLPTGPATAHRAKRPTLDDQITAAIYEQALEDDEPWAVDTHEQRAMDD